MQISGRWHLCDDGVERPVLPGEIQSQDGTWEKVLFLVDTGADRTVLSSENLAALQLQPIASQERLGGLGGQVDAAIIETTIRFGTGSEGKVQFRGQFAAVRDPEALDMSVLGRDVTGLFAVIVDRPGVAVCLLGQRHRYAVVRD